MSRTRPEGIPTEEEGESPTKKSGLLWALSIVLGSVLALGSIMGFVGRTLYVTREEYAQKNIQDAQDKTVFQQTLQRVDSLLLRQESAFEKLSETVQTLRIQVAGQQRIK